MRATDLERLARVRSQAANGEARRIRLQAGVSQAEVAAACGVTQPTVLGWERGLSVPRGKPALRYAIVLERLSADAPTEVVG